MCGGQETDKELDSGIDTIYPGILHRERLFYSKRLLLQAVASEATE